LWWRSKNGGDSGGGGGGEEIVVVFLFMHVTAYSSYTNKRTTQGYKRNSLLHF
jgi:hypothetical protein